MDKQKNFQNLPTNDDLPEGIPSVDEGWANMKNKLLQEMPGAFGDTSFQQKGNERKARKRYLLLLLLLLIIPIAWLGYYFSFSRNTGGAHESVAGKSQTGAEEEKRSIDQKNQEQQNVKGSILPSQEKSTEEASTSPNAISNAANNPKTISEPDLISSTKNVNAAKKVNVNRRSNRSKSPNNDNTSSAGKSARKKSPARKGQRNAVDTDKAEMSSVEYDTDKKRDDTPGNSIVEQKTTDTIRSMAEKPTVKADSISNTVTEEKEAGQAQGWVFSGGLQWTVQLPTYSSGDYFTGSSAQSQFYRVFIPGIWLRAKVDKSAIVAEVHPFYSNLVPAKVFETNVTSNNITDTVVITTENKLLRKTFGISAGLEYQYNIRSNWWIGGGIQGYFLNNAVARSDVQEERRALNGSGKTVTNYSSTYKIPREEWTRFNKTNAAISGHILYNAKKWEAGLRFALPVTSLSVQKGPKYPFRSEFLFRWPIYLQKK